MSEPYVGGKGDRQRPQNKEMFDLGYDMAFGKTPEIKAAARKRWLELKGKNCNAAD